MLTNLNKRLTFDKSPSKSKWLFKCNCGKECQVRLSDFTSGATTQCRACGAKSQGSALSTNHKGGLTNLRANHPLYNSWRCMIARCENPKHKNFQYWGGRGIKVCTQWKDFNTFVADVGPKPTSIHELDRYPNKDGDYEPGNVRWATPLEQANNRRARSSRKVIPK